MKVNIDKTKTKSASRPFIRLLGTTLILTSLAACSSSGDDTGDDDTTDTVAPVITLNGDEVMSVEAGTSYTDPLATATDDVDGDVSVTTTGTVDTSTVGTYTLTYSATDAAGNTGSATRTVNVVDTTPPTITLNGDATVSLVVGGSFTDPGATATDSVDGAVSVSTTGSVDTGTVGSYTLTYTATDTRGNTSSITRTVHVTAVADTTPPVITLNGAATVTIIVGDSFTDPGATASDNVDGSVAVTTTGSVDTNTVGSYTLVYSAKDGAGNTASANRTVHVVATPDTTPPVITLNGDASVTISVGATFTDPGATASDNIDGLIAVTKTGTVDTNTVGTYTITYNATDAAGNEATPVTRTVQVVDTVAPVISLLGDAVITVNQNDTFTDPGATATDNVDSSVTVTVSGTVDTSTVGTYTLTYNATDAAGNEAAPVTRTVQVGDVTAPVVSLSGDAEMTVNHGEVFTDPGATATDDVDGSVSVTTSGSVDTNTVGTYTLTYDATDAAGNTATPVTRTVHVVDGTAPEITLNGDAAMTVNQNEVFTDPGATATDNVDGTVSVSITGSVDVTTAGDYELVYNAKDAAGNEATPVTRTVTVADLTGPVITLTGDAEMNVDQGGAFTDPGATATDNVDSSVTVTASGTVDTNTVGTYTLTYDATDAAGNAATSVERTVNVLDITPPVITLNGESAVNLFVGDAFSDPGATATDDVDGSVTVITGGDVVDTTKAGIYTVVYTAVDTAGNEATANRTVVVSKVTRLNDTGITVAGWIIPDPDGAGPEEDKAGNNSDCELGHTNESLTLDAQDCSHGRDAEAAAATLDKVGGGVAGFDFTKLDSAGNDLAASAGSWSCVRDNHTGLIWEVKKSSGLHDSGSKFTWYSSDASNNGGDAGVADITNLCHGYTSGDSTTYCNTEAFVARVNAAGLCGASDWRLPAREELRSIVHYGADNSPRVDTDYFPNTSAFYWSSTPSVETAPYKSWGVGFNGGGDDRYLRSEFYRVRLVRDAGSSIE